MKLTRLEIYGFKSFPQRTDIRFDEGITGIVGPNGSGKSNIADAVRWVLGEQSAKALRGSKMEDVIFAGTQKRRLMPYCEVSLIFDNADKRLKSPHSEVMVTRRVYRSGEGEYYLNKKNCRLKDIVELFHDTGIGREGYSIIGQGHIDVILSGRGEERRAAFEEAAGIIGYRARKEEAERKLNRTQEHLLRVHDLLEELGSRLEPLKEQSKAARRYLDLSAQLKALDANIFLERHQRLSKRIASLEQSQQGIRELIAVHEAEIADCQRQRQHTDLALAQAEQEGDRLSALLNQEEEALRNQAVMVERSTQALQKAQEELERQSQSLEETLQEGQLLGKMLISSRQDSDQNAQLLEAAQSLLMQLETEANQALLLQNQQEDLLDQHRSRMLQAANSRSDARERQARQQAMLAQVSERRKDLLEQEAGLQQAVEDAQLQAVEADSRLRDTGQAVAALHADLQAAEQELKQGQEKAQHAQNQLAQSRLAFQRDQARLATMEELAKGHEGFMQPARQALLYGQGNPKIHGAVAHLISVPKELETALEMLLGGALQHIVTQDEETAQELINYLREKRYGRTTFLPLSAIRGRSLNAQEQQVLSLPGCLGLASELISYDQVYADVIASLLGRTVVARDLDAAIAISRAGRQAFHVVTLQGDVMRAGGAMTGGSVQSRTVSLLGREREIKELSQSLNQQAEQLLTWQQQADKMKGMIAAQEAALISQRYHVQDQEIGIAREEEQVKQARQKLEQAKEQLAQNQDACTQLADMVEQLEQDVKAAASASQLIEEDGSQMQQQEALLKQAMAEARDKAETLRQQVDKQREAKAQLVHQVDLLTRDRQRFEREQTGLDKKAQGIRQQQAQLALRIQQEQAGLQEVQSSKSQLDASIVHLREQTSRALAKRRELSASQAVLMDKSEQAHARHSQDSQRLHKGELSLTRLSEELQSMAATLWNTHELTYALAEAFVTAERFDLPAGEKQAADIRREIKEMGAINIHALDEYAQTQARFSDLSLQRDDAQQAREDLLHLIKRLQGQMEKQFVREFALLNEYFSETFKRLFNGGQASLSLADPSQPLDCEIQIKAQPPGKKLQLLSLLSGGERTLTAIAILFAMLKLKPTPFCILDEIEAALDDANINSFATYLAEYKKGTQFIVITHRKGTMESCDMLYGVTMREKGVSDMISVNLQEYTA